MRKQIQELTVGEHRPRGRPAPCGWGRVRSSRLVATIVAAVVALGGCALFQEDKSYSPVIDPAQFVARVDNPFFPLVPGTTMRYLETTDEGTRDVVSTVMPDVKVIAGVSVTVVHEVSSAAGEVHEDTWDWYAQDRAGNVWYFGEDTTEYERGKASKEGSWETGVKGAKPGIVMPAHPVVGRMDRQEYAVGEAEDQGQVIGVNETVRVGDTQYTGCVKTKEWSRLEPAVVEHKYYAPGIGFVSEVTIEGGAEHVELVGIEK